jgi:hypothetical protein
MQGTDLALIAPDQKYVCITDLQKMDEARFEVGQMDFKIAS